MERFTWTLPIFVVVAIANAFLWAIEAMSGNRNALVSVAFIILNLIGAWAIFSLWRKRRQKNDDDARSPSDAPDA